MRLIINTNSSFLLSGHVLFTKNSEKFTYEEVEDMLIINKVPSLNKKGIKPHEMSKIVFDTETKISQVIVANGKIDCSKASVIGV